MEPKTGRLTTTLTLALAAACALFMATATPAIAVPTVLEVNTAEDLPVDAGSAIPPTPGNLSAHPALDACLVSVRSSFEDIEENTINEELAAILDPHDAHVQTNATRPCSLRMALHLAPLLRQSLVREKPGQPQVRITFKTGLDTIEALASGVPLPPIVDPIRSTSRLESADRRGEIALDGCGDIDKTPALRASRPCVNIRIPEIVRSVLEPPPTTSLVSQDLVPGLIVAAPAVKIRGVAFLGGSPAIVTLPSARSGEISVNDGLEVTNSYFGMDKDGNTDDRDRPRVAIQLSSNDATIGGTTEKDRNVFASGEVGVLIAGGSNNRVQGNWFGTDDDGNANPDSLGTAVRVTGLRVDPDRIDEFLLQTSDLEAIVGENEATDGNPVPDETVTIPSPISLLGEKNTIGGPGDAGACTGACNVFAATEDVAIDIGGPTVEAFTQASLDGTGDPPAPAVTKVQGNRIGVDAQDVPAGNATLSNSGFDSAVLVRNGAARTAIEDNHVSHTPFGPGIVVADTAADDTKIERNVAWGNRESLIDLGGDGIVNEPHGPNAGVQPPEISLANPAVVSGTAAPRATVLVYRTQGPAGGQHASGHGDPGVFLGQVRASAAGTWSLDVNAGRSGVDRVTATADAGEGTSELARNRIVEPLPAPSGKPEPPPPPPPPSPPPPAPPAKPSDKQAPTVTRVFGRDVSGTPNGPVTVAVPTAIKGRSRDTAGIARIDVALARGTAPARSARRRPRSRQRMCRFVNFRRARYVRRSCNRPLYAKARGKTAWRLPLSRRTRVLLRRGRTFTLFIRTRDRLGNTATRNLVVRFR